MWCRLGTMPRRRIAIELHAVRRRVHDERASSSQACEHLVHARRHLDNASRSRDTMERLPHVAGDDGHSLVGALKMLKLTPIRARSLERKLEASARGV